MKKLLILLLGVFFVSASFAQRSVQGTITDETGEPLIGATILVKGTSIGTTTDFDGNFTINVPADNNVLVISYTGFKTQEVNVEGQQSVSVVLVSSAELLDEVVVTGYATELRREVSSAITSVKAEEIEGLPVQSFDRAIQGKASGVQISLASGAPGGAATIRVRGVGSINAGNDPLVIIDGVQIASDGLGQGTQGSANALAAINPNDIESIEILKDAASAAIYGAQGANGIIVVTTKSGSRQGKARFNASYQEGRVEPMNLYDVMNSQQYVDIRTQAIINAGLGQERAEQLYGRADDPDLTYYDWKDAIWRTGQFRTAEFSASGGNQNADYYTAFSYNKQEGQIRLNEFERLTARFNLNADLSEKFSINLRSSISYIRNFGTIANGNFVNSPASGAFWAMPISPAVDEEGNYNRYPTNGESHIFGYNILQGLNEEKRISKTLQNISSLALNYEILPNLLARASVGVDYINNRDLNNRPSTIPVFSSYGGSVFNRDRINFNWNTFGTLTYDFSLGEIHNFTALAGYEYKQEDFSNFDATGRGFADPSFINLGNAATPFAVGGTSTTNRRQGVFSSLKYSLNDKYIINGTLRYDGSSRFGSKNRWGTFYSGSVAWRMSEEGFLQGVGWLDELKLRASYGITGNSEIGDFAALPVFGTRGQYLGAPGLAPERLANDLLGWEEAEQLDIGLDFAVANSRIYGTVDVWVKNNRNLLLNTQIPQTAGIANSTITENVGRVQNRGIDLELNGVLVNTNGFRWSVGGTLSFQANEVKELNDGRDTIYSGNFPQLIVGQPLSFRFLLPFAGVNPANGRAMVYDKDGIPAYNADFEDARIFDGGIPDYYGGFRTEFSYKGLSLMGFFQFQGGFTVFNPDLYELTEAGGSANNQLASEVNYWRQPGDLTNTHKPVQGGVLEGVSQNFGFIGTTRYMSDGTYLRLKEIKVAYQFPSTMMSKAGLSGLTIYAQGLNLLTWTEFAGIDPEVQATTAFTGASAFWVYPLGRQYNVGLNLSF